MSDQVSRPYINQQFRTFNIFVNVILSFTLLPDICKLDRIHPLVTKNRACLHTLLAHRSGTAYSEQAFWDVQGLDYRTTPYAVGSKPTITANYT
jgi:hypothetical protein